MNETYKPNITQMPYHILHRQHLPSPPAFFIFHSEYNFFPCIIQYKISICWALNIPLAHSDHPLCHLSYCRPATPALLKRKQNAQPRFRNDYGREAARQQHTSGRNEIRPRRCKFVHIYGTQHHITYTTHTYFITLIQFGMSVGRLRFYTIFFLSFFFFLCCKQCLPHPRR